MRLAAAAFILFLSSSFAFAADSVNAIANAVASEHRSAENRARDTFRHPGETLALGDKDKEKYLAIGESDRFTLKFVKPGNPGQ